MGKTLQLAGLLFDMDGVIADTNPFHKEAIKVFCSKHGIEVDDDYLKTKVYGRTNQEWIPALFGNLSSAEVNAYADEKEAIFRDMYAPHLQLVPGLADFLAEASQSGIPCAVGTSAPNENARFILDNTGLSKQFEAVLDAAHVTKGKPAPEVYLKAAKAIGQAPAQCIVFEDALVGVAAGKAAGCKVVGIGTTHSSQELQEADLYTSDFQGLSIDKLDALFTL